MKLRNILIGAVLVLSMAITGFVFAQRKPVQNVSPKRHPNLAAARG